MPLAAGVAVVVAAAASAAAAVPAAVVAAPGAAAAAANHDEDEDDPQAGVVVSVVEAHVCHLALRHSMRRWLRESLAIEKFPPLGKNTGISGRFGPPEREEQEVPFRPC